MYSISSGHGHPNLPIHPPHHVTIYSTYSVCDHLAGISNPQDRSILVHGPVRNQAPQQELSWWSFICCSPSLGLPPEPSSPSPSTSPWKNCLPWNQSLGPNYVESWFDTEFLVKKQALVQAAAAVAKSLQSCPALCDPIDSSLPGSAIPQILQARTLEWVAISFSNAWQWKVKVKSHSRVRLFKNPWTAPYQAPSSMGFSRQEYWSGLPLPSLPVQASSL